MPERAGDEHGRESDAAEADHHDRLAGRGPRGVADRAAAGEHRAAEQGGDIGRDVGADRDDRAAVDDGMGRECGCAEVVRDRGPVPGQPGAAAEQLARGVRGRPALAGEAAVRPAAGALAAARQEGEHDPVADRDVADLVADGLDDAGGLVSEQHRHRTRPVAVHDRQVRVADPRRLDPDEQLGRAGIREVERADGDRQRVAVRVRPPDLLEHGARDPHATSPSRTSYAPSCINFRDVAAPGTQAFAGERRRFASSIRLASETVTDVVHTIQAPAVRTETDSLGTVDIPATAYWGAHTARALENFPISGRPISIHPRLVDALVIVKQAAARANRELGVLGEEKAELIEQACRLIRDGRFHDQFVVDVIQGGAGTSTNMNANEVVANVALELAGRPLGDYAFMNPIDDVNRSQSTNDVYPTAAKISIALALRDFLGEHEALRESFAAKGHEFHDVLKVGRTQLQDAVPMTLGQEFHGFATTLGEDEDRIREVLPLLREINLGATAIGTGITADPRYPSTVRRHLSELLGEEYITARDLVEATSDTGVFMQMSGVLKRAAVKLSKICNDLRLLSSGPQAGFGEIVLPPRQAGSSIMPGKVNPVIPEVVNQIAFAVVGHDVSRHDGGGGRPAAAERVRAAHPALDPHERLLARRRLQHAPRELRRRHPGEHRPARLDGRAPRWAW